MRCTYHDAEGRSEPVDEVCCVVCDGNEAGFNSWGFGGGRIWGGDTDGNTRGGEG